MKLMTFTNCGLLLAALTVSDPPLAAAKPVARIMGREISMKEISPTSKEMAKQRRELSAQKLVEWRADYRHQQLAGLIWQALRDDFCKRHDCKATAREIDELTRAMRKGMDESAAQWRTELRGIREKLKSSSLSQTKRRELLAQKRVLEENLANASPEKGEPSAAERGAENDVHKQVVEAWKFNRALHRKYGGRIIFQQFGIEPLDAYRHFLHEHEKKGSFVIFDGALRNEFWKYYMTMEHTYLEPGEASFDIPWWKQKKKKKKRSDE